MKTYLLLNNNNVVIGRIIAANICDAAKGFDNKIDDIGQLLSDEDYFAFKRGLN